MTDNQLTAADKSKACVLRAEMICKSFGMAGNKITVLEEVNINVGVGERVAIVGLSGSGKSTLLHLLAGLDTPDSGTVTVDGEDIAQLNEHALCQMRNQKLGFVYQFHYLMSDFTAVENVAMPLMISGLKKRQCRVQAEQMLQRVGLANRFGHRPGQLSGGERQRVAIARALVTRPLCVLADEPTGNLDEQTAEEVNQLLVDLSAELEMSFVIVTHNHSLAERMDRVLTLSNHKLVPLPS